MFHDLMTFCDQIMDVDEGEKKPDYHPFTLKRWNACAVWKWDVECDTCAICRLQLMEECLRCQADATKGPEKEREAPLPVKRGHYDPSRGPGATPPPPSTLSPITAVTAGASSSSSECVVVWGDCSHSFHNCCMAMWVKQNNRCPLCQQDWVVARVGK